VNSEGYRKMARKKKNVRANEKFKTKRNASSFEVFSTTHGGSDAAHLQELKENWGSMEKSRAEKQISIRKLGVPDSAGSVSTGLYLHFHNKDGKWALQGEKTTQKKRAAGRGESTQAAGRGTKRNVRDKSSG